VQYRNSVVEGRLDVEDVEVTTELEVVVVLVELKVEEEEVVGGGEGAVRIRKATPTPIIAKVPRTMISVTAEPLRFLRPSPSPAGGRRNPVTLPDRIRRSFMTQSRPLCKEARLDNKQPRFAIHFLARKHDPQHRFSIDVNNPKVRESNFFDLSNNGYHLTLASGACSP
jgi:hypothetical protein